MLFQFLDYGYQYQVIFLILLDKSGQCKYIIIKEEDPKKKGAFKMPRIYARITEDQEKLINKRAKEKGFIKPSGEVNISQYIRWLIEKEDGK